MKFKNLVMALAALCAVGCKKEITPASSSITDSKLKPNFKLMSVPTNGTYMVLGFGYDITDKFASADAVRSPILDVARFDRENGNRVIVDNSKSNYVSSLAAANATSLSDTLKAKLSLTTNFTVFKTTFSTNFTDQYSNSARYAYGMFNSIIRQQRLYFNAPESMLLNYVTPEFASDVQTQSAEYIVQHYGTHVMVDCILGAKLEVLYRSETRNSSRYEGAGVGANGAISKFININANFSYGSATSDKNFNQAMHYSTHGGDPGKPLVGTISFNKLSDTAATVNITDWSNSSTVANSELIDLNKNSLFPIWDFISDQNKANEVKNYIDSYLSANQFVMANDDYPSVPLYRFSNTRTGDHLVTTSFSEGNAANWNFDGQMGYIYTNPAPGLQPLYRYFINGYHFWTTNSGEVDQRYSEGVTGYIHVGNSAGVGEQGIYRYNAKSRNAHGHTYTTTFNEIGYGNNDWTYEGQMGYISR